jgi:gluconokinase
MKVPNLRSPSEKVGGLFHFGRMLDKIRLHAAGMLPADYIPNLGGGFDQRCCALLHIEYPALVELVRGGADDQAALEWAFQQGRRPKEEEMEIWNEFMRKRGWSDEATPILQRRLKEGGFEHRTEIQTMFQYIDLDEEKL